MTVSRLDAIATNTITVEFGVGGTQCHSCHYRVGAINISNTIVARNQFLSSKTQANLSLPIPYSQFFKVSALYTAAYLRKVSVKLTATKNQIRTGELKLSVLKLRGFDKYCALYKVNEINLLRKIDELGIKKDNTIVYVMTDLPQNSKHIRTLRNHFKNHYLFEARDIPIFRREPFVSTGTFLVYIVEMELMELADSYVTTYRGHGTSNPTKELGTIAPETCYEKHKFRPWNFQYKFWLIIWNFYPEKFKFVYPLFGKLFSTYH